MKRILTFPAVFLSLATVAFAADTQTQNTEPASGQALVDSVRFIEDADGSADLQTAIISMKNADGVQLDLISAVHVGDKDYYGALNEIFKDYDVVLYEMVGGPVGKRDETALKQQLGGIQLMQRLMQTMLGFQYQLDGIDYSAANFAHADVTLDELNALNEARDQNMMTLFMRAMDLENDPEMKKEMEEYNSEEFSQKLMDSLVNFSPNNLKRNVAPMLANAEKFMTKLEGKDGTVILTERNKVLMNFIHQHVGAGQKRIGVFYGAAHMPDMVTRLEAEGFQTVDTRWVPAWHMLPASAAGPTGWAAAENLLKDDSVVEGIFTILRGFLEQ